jgi:hypothetical protein
MRHILTQCNLSLAIFSGVLIALVCTSGCANKKSIVTPLSSTSAFDVPSLVGLDLAELKTKLGTPDNNTEPTPKERKRQTTWSKFWTRKDGTTLLVTYRIVGEKTVDLFLFTNESANGTRDKQSLLRAGNLKMTDPRYSVEFVQAKDDPKVYTGVKVTARKQ